MSSNPVRKKLTSEKYAAISAQHYFAEVLMPICYIVAALMLAFFLSATAIDPLLSVMVGLIAALIGSAATYLQARYGPHKSEGRIIFGNAKFSARISARNSMLVFIVVFAVFAIFAYLKHLEESSSSLLKQINQDTAQGESKVELGMYREELKKLRQDLIPIVGKKSNSEIRMRLEELKEVEAVLELIDKNELIKAIERLESTELTFPFSWLVNGKLELLLNRIEAASTSFDKVIAMEESTRYEKIKARLGKVHSQQLHDATSDVNDELEKLITTLQDTTDFRSYPLLLEARISRAIHLISTGQPGEALNDVQRAFDLYVARIRHAQFAESYLLDLVLLFHAVLRNNDSLNKSAEYTHLVESIDQVLRDFCSTIRSQRRHADLSTFFDLVLIHAVYSQRQSDFGITSDQIKLAAETAAQLRQENVISANCELHLNIFLEVHRLREAEKAAEAASDAMTREKSIAIMDRSFQELKNQLNEIPLNTPEHSVYSALVLAVKIQLLGSRILFGKKTEIQASDVDECTSLLRNVVHRTQNIEKSLTQGRMLMINVQKLSDVPLSKYLVEIGELLEIESERINLLPVIDPYAI